MQASPKESLPKKITISKIVTSWQYWTFSLFFSPFGPFYFLPDEHQKDTDNLQIFILLLMTKTLFSLPYFGIVFPLSWFCLDSAFSHSIFVRVIFFASMRNQRKLHIKHRETIEIPCKEKKRTGKINSS